MMLVYIIRDQSVFMSSCLHIYIEYVRYLIIIAKELSYITTTVSIVTKYACTRVRALLSHELHIQSAEENRTQRFVHFDCMLRHIHLAAVVLL